MRLALAFDRVQAAFSPTAAVRHGAWLIAAGHLERAFRCYARAARTGSAEAEYRTGRCYLEGTGVPPCRAEGARWLTQAATRGHVEAQLLLATLHLDGAAAQVMAKPEARAAACLFAANEASGPDHATAARWARMAAEAGSARAQAVLAFILTAGPGHLRNLEEADAWYERSARAGCPQGKLGYALALSRKGGSEAAQREVCAQLAEAAEAELPMALYLLGVINEHGLGGKRDQGAAARLYRRAAEKGCRPAQLRWGLALMLGLGVRPDLDGAETWLRCAALAGEPEAAALVGDLHAGRSGLPPNYGEAARWFRRAAEAGHRRGAQALGLLYLTGTGVARDLDEARHWLRLSAEAGDATARAELGNLALRGVGGPDDRLRIRQWFEQKAAAGDPIAAFNYAVCLTVGVGGPCNDTLAATWLRRAADHVADAQYWYGRFLLEGRGLEPDLAAGRAWIARAADAARPALVPASAAGAVLTEGAMNSLRDTRCACGSGLITKRCCDLDPAYVAAPAAVEQADALASRAAKVLASGDSAAAEALCLRALDLAPRLPGGLWTLYQIRHRAGQRKAAVALLGRLVAFEPNNIEATQELAMLLFRLGDLQTAEQHARNAVRLAPANPLSHNLLGMILTETQRPQTGEFHYRRVLELSAARDPIVLANLAWNLKNQGRIAEARALYEESAEAAPNVFQTFLGWAQLEEADGDFAAAQSHLDHAAGIRPDDPALRVVRATLLSREGDDLGALAELERDAGGDNQASNARAGLDPNALLVKGRILDRLQRCDDAFACFAEAKRQAREWTGKAYFDREARDAAERLRRFFVSGRLRLMPAVPTREGSPQPIFILGFPRSGTTLAEQALCGHPKISAGDELPFVNELSDAIPRLFGSPLPYPEALAELWMGDNRRALEIVRDIYLRKVEMRGIVGPGRAWFTDKMPLNEMHLGLIFLLFPRTPLVHIIRHPLDVVLSVFSHHLTHGYFCAYALETIAQHYVLIMDLVQHYRAEMALRYLPVRYEDMVDDMSGSLRRILTFIGEAFDERCVNFQENRRRPLTPSYAQVTEGLHDRSRFRYRRYLRHLEPVIPVLRPVIDRLGYTLG